MSRPVPWHLVVTGAKSRTHLVHVASYVRWLLARSDVGDVHVSFVPASGFLAAPDVTLDDAREFLPADARLTLEEGVPGWRFRNGHRATYVAVGAPGLKAWAALRRHNLRRRIHIVVTDEGIGTYGSVVTRRSAMLRQNVHPVVATGKAAVIASASQLLTSQRWPAYRAQRGTWRVTARVADEFRRHTRDAQPATSHDAVILTQPFADMGLVDEETQRAYVVALSEAATAAGLRPVIRPHPAENVSRYAGFALMPTRGTAELDPGVVNAAVVIGGPSTALVNLSAMFGARVLWVSVPGLEHLDTEISRAQAQIFAAFLGAPVPVSSAREALVGRMIPARPLGGEPSSS